MPFKFETPDGKTRTPEEMKQAFEQYRREQETKANRPIFGAQERKEAKSVGEIFTKSNAYKRFFEHGQSASDSVPFQKALIGSRDGGGSLMGGSMSAGVVGLSSAPLTIRDLLNVTTTQNNAVYYMEQLDFTNNAAPAPEGTLKPESDMTFTERTALVKTIAHWIPATRQALADVAGLQNLIDTQLMTGLKQVEEAQLLYGTGVDENVDGIMTNDNVQTIGGIPSGSTAIDHLRRAITLATQYGDIPNGIVLHPVDWEALELTKDASERYILVPDVSAGGAARVWRLPVVVSSSMIEGDFLVGAFNTGATIYDRETAEIRISEHHADFFTRNQKAILCEERLAFTVQKPKAFVKGVFTTA